MIVDSGITENAVPVGKKVINIRAAHVPIAVKLTSGEIVKSTQTGLLPNKNIPLGARKVHIFPYLKHALVSI